VKQIALKEAEDYLLKEFADKVAGLIKIAHPHLVMIHSIEVKPQYCNIISDLQPLGSLRNMIANFGKV
jgi:hypothetical protein